MFQWAKCEKLPAEVIGNAVRFMRTATGELEEEFPDDGKNWDGQALGKKRRRARKSNLTVDQPFEMGKNPAKWR